MDSDRLATVKENGNVLVTLNSDESMEITEDRWQRLEDIARMIGRGKTNKEIAEKFDVTPNTISKDRSLIREMDSSRVRDNLFEQLIQNLVRSKEEAIRTFWEIAEESAEISDHDTRRKAVKNAIDTEIDIIKELRMMGMDMKRLKEEEDKELDEEQINDKIKEIQAEVKDISDETDDT